MTWSPGVSDLGPTLRLRPWANQPSQGDATACPWFGSCARARIVCSLGRPLDRGRTDGLVARSASAEEVGAEDAGHESARRNRPSWLAAGAGTGCVAIIRGPFGHHEPYPPAGRSARRLSTNSDGSHPPAGDLSTPRPHPPNAAPSRAGLKRRPRAEATAVGAAPAGHTKTPEGTADPRSIPVMQSTSGTVRSRAPSGRGQRTERPVPCQGGCPRTSRFAAARGPTCPPPANIEPERDPALIYGRVRTRIPSR
mgnify:CR=1 FL=1